MSVMLNRVNNYQEYQKTFIKKFFIENVNNDLFVNSNNDFYVFNLFYFIVTASSISSSYLYPAPKSLFVDIKPSNATV